MKTSFLRLAPLYGKGGKRRISHQNSQRSLHSAQGGPSLSVLDDQEVTALAPLGDGVREGRWSGHREPHLWQATRRAAEGAGTLS